MTDTRWAVCGEGELAEKHGTYVFEWPADFPVESSRFDDATWWVCGSCDEEACPLSSWRESRRSATGSKGC